MYGKAFESMYEGSMIGAGLNVFAVWNYVIAKTHRGIIELNPKLLVAILGGTQKEIEQALEFLCQPDPESRSKEEDGRRLVREGQFQYRVVNWDRYQKIRSEDDRREYNRQKQAEYRARKREAKPTKATANNYKREEKAYIEALDRGDTDAADRAAMGAMNRVLGQ